MVEEKTLFLILAIVMVVVAMTAPILIYATRYKKVPPDKAMVVFGRQMPGGRGYVVVSGGGKFIIPIIESYEMLDLSAKVCDIELKGLTTGGGTLGERISISTSTTYKVSSEAASLNTAAEHLLHVPDEEIRKMVQGILEGHIRGMVAALTYDQIEHDRDETARKIYTMASMDLRNLGLEIRAFSIKGVQRLE